MSTMVDHSRKVKMALGRARVGSHPASRAAMLDAIPRSALARLTAADLAEMLDAMWSVTQRSKVPAAREALDEGIVWDAAQQRHREIAR